MTDCTEEKIYSVAPCTRPLRHLRKSQSTLFAHFKTLVCSINATRVLSSVRVLGKFWKSSKSLSRTKSFTRFFRSLTGVKKENSSRKTFSQCGLFEEAVWLTGDLFALLSCRSVSRSETRRVWSRPVPCHSCWPGSGGTWRHTGDHCGTCCVRGVKISHSETPRANGMKLYICLVLYHCRPSPIWMVSDLHVRTCVALFCISGTAESIDFRIGVYWGTPQSNRPRASTIHRHFPHFADTHVAQYVST